MPILKIDIPDELYNRIESTRPDYLDRKGFVCLILDQHLDSGSRLPAYRVGAGNRNGVSHTLPLQFPPALEVTNSEAPTKAVEAVPSEDSETSKNDLGVNSKKPRAKKAKGCDEFETFWKTYTAFEHRANK